MVPDVCDHQGKGDHHIGLNVTCFALCDELQIVLKCMRFAEVLCNDLMNIWNPPMLHPTIEVLNLFQSQPQNLVEKMIERILF